MVGAVEVTVADDVLAAEREVALGQRIGRVVFAVGTEVAQVEVGEPERDVLVVHVFERPFPAQLRRAGLLHPRIDGHAVALRGVEIAAAHADFRDGIFERAVHRQVAHRDTAVRDFEVGDPERRTRRRASRGVGRRDFCRRGFHQSGEIVAFGRHFEQRRESRNIDAVEYEAHFAQIALGEFYTQRIDARHGPLLPVAQGEARQRSRTLGRERKQVFRVAAQADVGRQAAVHGRDVERLPEIGQRARQREVLQAYPDVEFRAFDVVAHVGRERTALGEVEHGPDVGFLAGEIDARNVQVYVVHAPLGIEREVLVKDPAVAD